MPRLLAHHIATALVTLTALAPGCGLFGTRVAPPTVPADFALEFAVQGPADSKDPITQSSQHVLLADRMLRVATGAGANPRYFPQPTRRLTHAEVEAIYSIIRDRHLLAEPLSPQAQAHQAGTKPQTVIYQVRITADGRTHEYATTPGESPPTVQLLQALVDLHPQRETLRERR